jgi:tetratricopeptide (TPR) repeat protein
VIRYSKAYNPIMHSRLRDTASAFLLRAVCLATIAACIFPLYSRAQSLSPEARRHFELARHAQDANQFDQAAREYTATIHLAPTFPGAYMNLGLVDYVQGDFNNSSIALAKALQLDPKLVGASLYLGIDQMKLNHPEKALPHLQRAAQLDPVNKDAQSWLGTAYWQTGQTWTALEQFRKADKNFPNDPDILFVLGEAYRKTADQEIESLIHNASGTAFVHEIFGDIYLDQHALAKAAGHYQAALQQDPSAPNIHFKLGEVALLGDHLDDARSEYLRQLKIAPDDAAAKARLAEIDLLNQQIASALPQLEQALALSPLQTVSALHLPPSFATTSDTFDDAMLQRLRHAQPAVQSAQPTPARDLALALIAAKLNQPDALTNAWAQFQQSIPHQTPAPDLFDRATQDFERQSFEKADNEIHTWLESHPQSLPGQYLAARVHRMLSLAILDQLLSSFPDSYRSHQLLAQTYEQRDDDDKAIAEYKKVEELAPTLPGIHYALGHLLVQQGDLEGATTQLKEELRLNPDQPEANAEMGMTFLNQGQTDAAIPYLTKAISLQPDLWTAHQELGKAYYQQKNYADAQKELALALADDPEGIAHYQLALVYKALGETESANREFTASRKIKADRLSQVKIEMPAGTKND